MDSFFASIEMRERPQLKAKPIAVGGASRRGIVTTCNYVARKFGVRSAMPGFMAKKLCPSLIFLPIRGRMYREESRKIRQIVESVVSPIEVASVDEMYFKIDAPLKIVFQECQKIRKRIYDETELTASVGIAPTKMLAKICSDINKPNGIFLLPEDKILSFMEKLPIQRIPGIGPKASERFQNMGLKTCGQLQKMSLDQLQNLFGQWGLEIYERCRGVDHRNIKTERLRKSFSVERTLIENIENEEDLKKEMSRVWNEFSRRFENEKNKSPLNYPVYKCFSKIKFSNFQRVTREKICSEPHLEDFQELALNAFCQTQDAVRLIGLGVRFACPQKPRRNYRQLNFFEEL